MPKWKENYLNDDDGMKMLKFGLKENYIVDREGESPRDSPLEICVLRT